MESWRVGSTGNGVWRIDWIGCRTDDERDAVGGVWAGALEASGVEMLRFWEGANVGAGPLAALWVAGAFPETVCRIVSGDGVRSMLLASDDDGLVLSALRTSFSEIFEPVGANCHGDAGLLFCT